METTAPLQVHIWVYVYPSLLSFISQLNVNILLYVIFVKPEMSLGVPSTNVGHLSPTLTQGYQICKILLFLSAFNLGRQNLAFGSIMKKVMTPQLNAI